MQCKWIIGANWRWRRTSADDPIVFLFSSKRAVAVQPLRQPSLGMVASRCWSWSPIAFAFIDVLYYYCLKFWVLPTWWIFIGVDKFYSRQNFPRGRIIQSASYSNSLTCLAHPNKQATCSAVRYTFDQLYQLFMFCKIRRRIIICEAHLLLCFWVYYAIAWRWNKLEARYHYSVLLGRERG